MGLIALCQSILYLLHFLTCLFAHVNSILTLYLLNLLILSQVITLIITLNCIFTLVVICSFLKRVTEVLHQYCY